jgi:hypothetical protein
VIVAARRTVSLAAIGFVPVAMAQAPGRAALIARGMLAL